MLAVETTGQRFNTQINNHMRGQYEWLLSFPLSASSTEEQGDRHSQGQRDHTLQTVAFGCNLISHNKRPGRFESMGETWSTDVYTLLATPLTGDAFNSLHAESCEVTIKPGKMNLFEPPPPYESVCQDASPPVKTPKGAARPPLPSENGSSLTDEPSQANSLSESRIEDSLAELDRLEDELEAVNAVASSRRGGSTQRTPQRQSATVRLQPIKSPHKHIALRRSASLTLRDKTDRRMERLETPPEPQLTGTTPQSRYSNTRSLQVLTPVKSTKPLTRPNFELPGELVARRLKEQREARQAQQAVAQKPYIAPPRPKSSKPLTKPSFELPGEAISRRKREEREVRLRVEEEAERKRREFKARPFRMSTLPATLPRETIASRARHGKLAHDDHAAGQSNSNALKRLSVGVGHTPIHKGSQPLPEQPGSSRGRDSMILPADATSRGTSTSAVSIGKRSSVSIEDITNQRIRGREIFTRDNTFTHTKEQERKERESVAKAAREAAAERSRAASREWAEKKRRKDLALKQAAKATTEQFT